MKREKSESNAQQKAEREMISLLGQQLGIQLESKRLKLDDGSSVQIDGYHEHEKRRILVEAFARTKRMKAGQKRKILGDILKLIFVSETLLVQEVDLVIDKFLLFQSETAANDLRGNSWAAKACEHFQVRLLVQPAADSTFHEVQQAEIDQNLLNSGSDQTKKPRESRTSIG
jgi:hypothetical protein